MLKYFAIALTSALVTQAAYAQKHSYRVNIDPATNKAKIEASIYLEGHHLSLFNTNPMPGYPNGQADFIENLQIVDMHGKSVPVENKGEGEYEVVGNQALRLSYEVKLNHDKLNWPAGNEEVLYHTKEGIMFTGYSLFLVPSEKMSGDTELEFVLPPTWRAHASLQATASPHRFIAKSRRELVNNAYFVGTAQSTQIDAGGLKVELLLGKPYWEKRQVIVDLLQAQLSSYQTLFGAKPKSDRYLIIINQGDSGDGGAFSGSFSQFLRGDAETRTRPIWGRVLAHELLHFWNGLSLVPATDQEEWFKEGVTDYLTIRTLAKNKLIDRDYLMQWLANLSRGQLVARRAQGIQGSVREAAKDKHQNWLLVYGGGSIAGLALDVELRKASHDQLGLEDLMKRLYTNVALQGKTYTLSDIGQTAYQLTGQRIDTLLTSLVESPTAVDLRPIFRELGLQLEEYLLLEHFLLPASDATSQQKKRFKRMFN